MQMLDSAHAGKWDDLPLHEQQRGTILAELKSGVCNGINVRDSTSRKLAEMIAAILKADAETRSLAGAWRDELQGILGSMSTERKLSDTYGT